MMLLMILFATSGRTFWLSRWKNIPVTDFWRQ